MSLRCDTCNGRKKVLGMGGMMKACEACGGSGWQVSGLCAPSVEPVLMDKRSKAYRELKKTQRC